MQHSLASGDETPRRRIEGEVRREEAHLLCAAQSCHRIEGSVRARSTLLAEMFAEFGEHTGRRIEGEVRREEGGGRRKGPYSTYLVDDLGLPVGGVAERVLGRSLAVRAAIPAAVFSHFAYSFRRLRLRGREKKARAQAPGRKKRPRAAPHPP